MEEMLVAGLILKLITGPFLLLYLSHDVLLYVCVCAPKKSRVPRSFNAAATTEFTRYIF